MFLIALRVNFYITKCTFLNFKQPQTYSKTQSSTMYRKKLVDCFVMTFVSITDHQYLLTLTLLKINYLLLKRRYGIFCILPFGQIGNLSCNIVGIINNIWQLNVNIPIENGNILDRCHVAIGFK